MLESSSTHCWQYRTLYLCHWTAIIYYPKTRNWTTNIILLLNLVHVSDRQSWRWPLGRPPPRPCLALLTMMKVWEWNNKYGPLCQLTPGPRTTLRTSSSVPSWSSRWRWHSSTAWLNISVTRWLDYFLKIWPFRALKICLIGLEIFQSRITICLPNTKLIL